MTAETHPTKFDELVATTDKPILVDFWADWCGPCHMIAPTIKELAKEFAGRAVVVKVDVDASPNISRQFAIQSIPTLMIFHHGKIVWRASGVRPHGEIADQLNSLLEA